ncbi:MAG: glycosyltransferase, partial [Proteobacteria bacterium]|nr:glycosyltransferase [Pseudomonadota bacterium]
MTVDSSWWMAALVWLPAFSAFVSFVALMMTRVNLGVYGRAAPRPAGSASVDASDATPVLTICIPARNEERNVEAVVRGALANAGVPLEVLVYDDQSTDRTPTILAALRGEDARVRAVTTEPLPAGWNGKQWG